MAYLTCNFFSKSLMRTVNINVVLPTDKENEIKEYKTLYLLHGIYGSQNDWVHGTRIEAWAQDHNLAVVMPSGENKFYVDHPQSNAYFSKFIGEELVSFTRRSFPLSTKREDTFIGGLSMGGYGAMVNGLKYHETFGSIIALSSAFILDLIVRSNDNSSNPLHRRSYYESIFGNLDEIKGSDKDYIALVNRLEISQIPDIYMACGTEDSLLYRFNVKFHQYLDQKQIPHTFETGPGGHDWIFWDTYIKRALDWLELEEEKGISSGNVNL